MQFNQNTQRSLADTQRVNMSNMFSPKGNTKFNNTLKLEATIVSHREVSYANKEKGFVETQRQILSKQDEGRDKKEDIVYVKKEITSSDNIEKISLKETEKEEELKEVEKVPE